MNNQLLQVLTTEHSALQSARVGTITESTGRAALYLSTVGSAVVALAFIGQATQDGTSFFLFALTVLPALFFLGIVTYLRLFANAVEDMYYARAINRIRQAYLTLDPEAVPYFLLSGHDDIAGVFANTGVTRPGWYLLSHTASVIIVINNVIGGVFVALALEAVVDMTVLEGAVIGSVVTLALVGGALWYQHRRWETAIATIPVAFPSPPGPKRIRFSR